MENKLFESREVIQNCEQTIGILRIAHYIPYLVIFIIIYLYFHICD